MFLFLFTSAFARVGFCWYVTELGNFVSPGRGVVVWVLESKYFVCWLEGVIFM